MNREFVNAQHRVVLYVVPGCPLCEDARTWLRGHDVEFEERDVANGYAALRRMYRLTRQGLVPVVEKDGTALVRPSDAELELLLAT